MFDKCRKLVTPFDGMACHSVEFLKDAVIELDIAEEKINRLQQLKSEIAALADRMDCLIVYPESINEKLSIKETMRQLSAF